MVVKIPVISLNMKSFGNVTPRQKMGTKGKVLCVCVLLTVCTGALSLNPQSRKDKWLVGGYTKPFRVAQKKHIKTNLRPSFLFLLSYKVWSLPANWSGGKSRWMLCLCCWHTLYCIAKASGGQYDPSCGKELQTGCTCAHVCGTCGGLVGICYEISDYVDHLLTLSFISCVQSPYISFFLSFSSDHSFSTLSNTNKPT